MRCVVDASVVLAALVASDESHDWATGQLARISELAAPHILLAEVANKLRKFVARSLITDQHATFAYANALALPFEFFPYEPVADRVWELRNNVSAYDAWYVALAEILNVPLVTLDHRLVRATGPRCTFIFHSAWAAK